MLLILSPGCVRYRVQAGLETGLLRVDYHGTIYAVDEAICTKKVKPPVRPNPNPKPVPLFLSLLSLPPRLTCVYTTQAVQQLLSIIKTGGLKSSSNASLARVSSTVSTLHRANSFADARCDPRALKKTPQKLSAVVGASKKRSSLLRYLTPDP